MKIRCKIAVGVWLYFFDSDDYIADDAIEQLMDCAVKNQLDIVIGTKHKE